MVFWVRLFIWHRLSEDAGAPYVRALKTCLEIEVSSDEFWKEHARDPVELQQRIDEDFKKYHKCESDAGLEWKSRRSSDGALFAMALVITLATIVLSWLIVWGCVAVVRWIRRGFADAT